MEKGLYRLLPTDDPHVFTIGPRLPDWRVRLIKLRRFIMRQFRRRERWSCAPKYFVVNQRRRFGIITPAAVE